MRQGVNPGKSNGKMHSYARHRAIIPVYIPHLTGYFEHSLAVLKLCLESLHLTGAEDLSITVVSNGSSPDVVAELQKYLMDGRIDQLVCNCHNRGKVDAVLSVARGAFEELITIADCDVLFKPGWVSAIHEIFRVFPECGFVSPAPDPALAWHCTSATILGGLACRELAAAPLIPSDDLSRFARSIGQPQKYESDGYRRHLFVKRNGTKACVGCGHYVFTIRRDVLRAIPKQPSLAAISGASEEKWLDIPPDQTGYWRLATTRAYAYHLGNIPEAWMYEELAACRPERAAEPLPNPLPQPTSRWVSRVPWRVREAVAKRLHKGLVGRRLFRLLVK
jgi:hypothetical protein